MFWAGLHNDGCPSLITGDVAACTCPPVQPPPLPFWEPWYMGGSSDDRHAPQASHDETKRGYTPDWAEPLDVFQAKTAG